MICRLYLEESGVANAVRVRVRVRVRNPNPNQEESAFAAAAARGVLEWELDYAGEG